VTERWTRRVNYERGTSAVRAASDACNPDLDADLGKERTTHVP
jgi:hypothetical protein